MNTNKNSKIGKEKKAMLAIADIVAEYVNVGGKDYKYSITYSYPVSLFAKEMIEEMQSYFDLKFVDTYKDVNGVVDIMLMLEVTITEATYNRYKRVNSINQVLVSIEDDNAAMVPKNDE